MANEQIADVASSHRIEQNGKMKQTDDSNGFTKPFSDEAGRSVNHSNNRKI